MFLHARSRMHYFLVDFLKVLYFFSWLVRDFDARSVLRDLIEARLARFLELVRGRLVASLLFSLKASSITDNG